MDVREQPANGKALGKGNAEGQEAPAQKKEILNRSQARWLAFGKQRKGQFRLTRDQAQKMVVNKLYAQKSNS
jgi:hypothetical protein